MSPTCLQISEKLSAIRQGQVRVGFDLEGFAVTGMTDCSFATSPSEAIWIPFKRMDGSPWWAPEEQQAIMEAVKVVLEDPAVPKVGHNLSYELFVLKWAHGITLRGIGGDSMFSWHEFQPELDKSIDVPASLLTRTPFWKNLRLGAETEEERAFYNITDSCLALELVDIIEPLLTEGQREHLAFNLSLLEPMADMMFRGIRFDVEGRQQLVQGILREVAEMQGELDNLAHIRPPALSELAQIVCYKRKLLETLDWSSVIANAKPSWQEPVGDPVAEAAATLPIEEGEVPF